MKKSSGFRSARVRRAPVRRSKGILTSLSGGTPSSNNSVFRDASQGTDKCCALSGSPKSTKKTERISPPTLEQLLLHHVVPVETCASLRGSGRCERTRSRHGRGHAATHKAVARRPSA